MYGQSLGILGRFAEGKPFLEKGLFFARDMNNLLSLAVAEMHYGTFHWVKGDAEKCVKHLQASIEYMEKSEFHTILGPVWAWLGMGYLVLGRTNKAIECAEKGLEIHTDLGLPLFLGTIHAALGCSHLEADDLKNAMVHAEQALDLSRKNNEKLFEAEARILLGRVIAATERKQFDQAREQILKGISMHAEHKRKPNYAIGLLYLGEIYAEAGQPEAALENLKKAENLFQEMGMVYWPDKAREILAAL
jgi:tetratricopeptide (TPR) repeat protein